MAAEKKQKKKQKLGSIENLKKSRFLDKISIFHKNVTCIYPSKAK